MDRDKASSVEADQNEASLDCPSCEYSTATETEMLAHLESTEDEAHAEQREKIEDAPDLATLTEILHKNGATYVAMPTDSLVEEPAHILYHLPAGTSDSQKETIEGYLEEEVGDRPLDGQIGIVRINGDLMPTSVRHILGSSLHLHRRTPLYVAEGTPGLSPVTPEEGVASARQVAAQGPEASPKQDKTVTLAELVASLADAGAASVEMRHESLMLGSPEIDLRIPIIPANGKPIVGPVGSVEAAGETYPLRTTLTMGGPGNTPGRTAIYVSENVRGAEPIAVEEGLEAAYDALGQAEEVDMLSELNSKLRR